MSYWSDDHWREEVTALVRQPPPDGESGSVDPRLVEAVERYERELGATEELLKAKRAQLSEEELVTDMAIALAAAHNALSVEDVRKQAEENARRFRAGLPSLPATPTHREDGGGGGT